MNEKQTNNKYVLWLFSDQVSKVVCQFDVCTK